MLKFFRKYNKIILGFGFAFLMVIFLLPQGVSRLVGDPRDRTAYTYDGGRITEGELIHAGQEVEFLERLYPPLKTLFLAIESPLHWVLLTREAEAARLVGGPEDGRNSLTQFAESFADLELNRVLRGNQAAIQSQRDSMIVRVHAALEQARAQAINAGQTADAVDLVLAQARGVVRMYSTYLDSITLSRPELAQATRNALDSAKIEYAQITAAAQITDDTPEPSEDDIRRAFQTYRDTPRGEGEHGFGYRRENAVKLEWMLVNRAEIEKAVVLDPVEVNVHWQKNRAKYKDSFAQARPSVERELRNAKVARVLAQVKVSFKAAILQATAGLETDEFGKPIPGPNWPDQRPSFRAIALRIAREVLDRTGVVIPPPDTLSDPRWLTKEDVATLPVINVARTVIGRTAVALPDLVFSLEALGGPGGMDTRAGIAHTEPLVANSGTLCFFRIDDIRPASPPESVDEVRPLIVNDLKRLHEYDRLVDKIDTIEAAALKDGFEQATVPYHVTALYPDVVVTRDRFGRTSNASEEDRGALRNAVMDKAERLDPTAPAKDAPLADRLVLVAQPSTLSLAMAQITSVDPTPLETYQSLADDVLLRERGALRRSPAWPFTFDAMKRRHNVAEIRGRSSSNDEDAADADAKASPGDDQPSKPETVK